MATLLPQPHLSFFIRLKGTKLLLCWIHFSGRHTIAINCLPRHAISVAWNYQLHQSLFAIERVMHWQQFVQTSNKDNEIPLTRVQYCKRELLTLSLAVHLTNAFDLVRFVCHGTACSTLSLLQDILNVPPMEDFSTTEKDWLPLRLRMGIEDGNILISSRHN